MQLVDPERLCVGGWSYGGILTNHVITKVRAPALFLRHNCSNVSSQFTNNRRRGTSSRRR
jgi:dipeptidyl aminopeptidase/acylaminoacyl peptidase